MANAKRAHRLYRLAIKVEDGFRAALVAEYGESNAGDERYRFRHENRHVQHWATRFKRVSGAMIEAMRREREAAA